MSNFSYPPCNINPMTEKPYLRHKWEIAEKQPARLKQTKAGPVTFYRVRCVRCGLNDPRAPVH